MRISSNIHDLDEGRIIATLRGFLRRIRVCNSPFAFFSTTPNHVHFDYNYCEGYFIPYHLDPEERSFCKDYMDSYLKFEKERLFHAISEDEDLLKGIFFTKHGQCAELKTVRLVTDNNETGRMEILINLRRDWQSYRFKEKKKNKLHSLSIIDFAKSLWRNLT